MHEAIRHSLGRALVRPLLDEHGDLKVVTLDRSIEEECNRAVTAQSGNAASAALQPSTARRVLEGLRTLFGEQALSAPPVLLCSSPGRFYLRRLLEPFLPKIVVLA
jgi:flagellar biosynthesis protein FlhA